MIARQLASADIQDTSIVDSRATACRVTVCQNQLGQNVRGARHESEYRHRAPAADDGGHIDAPVDSHIVGNGWKRRNEHDRVRNGKLDHVVARHRIGLVDNHRQRAGTGDVGAGDRKRGRLERVCAEAEDAGQVPEAEMSSFHTIRL